MIALANLVWGAPQWAPIAAVLAAVLLAVLAWGYWRAGSSRSVRVVAAGLKALGILILLACLLEPLISGQRAKPGANQFVVLIDNSQSMTVGSDRGNLSRAEQVKALMTKDSPWLLRLAQDFDLRSYIFDQQLRPMPDSAALPFDGRASALSATLDRLARRFNGRPIAGVLLFTDGNATDRETVERLLARSDAGNALPPIYPVLPADEAPVRDLNLQRLHVSQTNFEDAPVTVTAHVASSGYKGRTVLAELLDESGKAIEQQKVRVEKEDEPLAVRFKLRPEQAGVSFYRVRVSAEGEAADAEATLENNARLIAVDRGQGPYRVLYVAGRPNWEFKFLNRAVQADDQVQLLGLLRIARREPKFNFIGRRGDDSNPLFRGFDNKDEEQVEQYDQPVIVRLGTQDQSELRDGFPRSADELFRYHAVILDDVEAEFFSADQMSLLKEFVRQRGGGLLMLGGQESFRNGKFDRTPIGDLLPVYADDVPAMPADGRYRLTLTREGWLEPWLRLHPEEEGERQRLESMPAFQTFNSIRGIKPGATVLARATLDGGEALPALVEQRFGQGRVAAMMIGDLWRWDLRRPEDAKSDLGKAWRQTVRWLVAEVPKRVEIVQSESRDGESTNAARTLAVQVRDAEFNPLDNAAVTVRITAPDGKTLELPAEPSPRQAGLYEATYVPREAGAYRAGFSALAPDGSEVGQAQAGWTSDPAAEEFNDLRPNVDLLRRLANETGGQVVEAGKLERFVATLPDREVQITEPYVKPVWHQSWVFLLAIGCLTAEWGLRRWKGLP